MNMCVCEVTEPEEMVVREQHKNLRVDGMLEGGSGKASLFPEKKKKTQHNFRSTGKTHLTQKACVVCKVRQKSEYHYSASRCSLCAEVSFVDL